MLNYERPDMGVCLKRRRGYTLMEVMTVLVVIAVVVALAYPFFVIQSQKVESQEGVSVLSALYLAQKDYREDSGAYSGDVTDLGVSIPAMQNFKNLTVYSSNSVSCQGVSFNALASVEETAGTYTLFVLEDGRVVCNPCAGICTKLGFDLW